MYARPRLSRKRADVLHNNKMISSLCPCSPGHGSTRQLRQTRPVSAVITRYWLAASPLLLPRRLTRPSRHTFPAKRHT